MSLIDDIVDDSIHKEILESLSTNDGLTGEDLYEQSTIADGRIAVSKAISDLRNTGKVVSKMVSGKRIFQITPQGLAWISGGQAKVSLLREKKTRSRKKEGPTFSMVPVSGEEGVRCMLASDGSLSLNAFDVKTGQHQVFHLSPVQVPHLLVGLAGIYPKLVETSED